MTDLRNTYQCLCNKTGVIDELRLIYWRRKLDNEKLLQIIIDMTQDEELKKELTRSQTGEQS